MRILQEKFIDASQRVPQLYRTRAPWVKKHPTSFLEKGWSSDKMYKPAPWIFLPVMLRNEFLAKLVSLCGDCFHQTLLRGKNNRMFSLLSDLLSS